MAGKPIGVACDHAGLELKKVLVAELGRRGHDVRDFGTDSAESVDYPDFAHALAKSLANEEIERGLLVCGTGVGMSISANRHPVVRAVVCSEPLSARMARKHNDANVLCVGARVVGSDTALDILGAFLDADYEGGRHARRVAKITPP
ncbi:MAG TPA: ribose 5-phosphate isomerase B [Polyangiaceae bacterium]|nr:ribose 5-phosphate isomerase B [Polyangiaceae bacterium]